MWTDAFELRRPILISDVALSALLGLLLTYCLFLLDPSFGMSDVFVLFVCSLMRCGNVGVSHRLLSNVSLRPQDDTLQIGAFAFCWKVAGGTSPVWAVQCPKRIVVA